MVTVSKSRFGISVLTIDFLLDLTEFFLVCPLSLFSRDMCHQYHRLVPAFDEQGVAVYRAQGVVVRECGSHLTADIRFHIVESYMEICRIAFFHISRNEIMSNFKINCKPSAEAELVRTMPRRSVIVD